MQLTISLAEYEIFVTAESPDIPRYEVRSADNVCSLNEEFFLGDASYRPSSCHRVEIRHGKTVIACRVILANGGAGGVNSHSALVHDECCFVAVGPYVCALSLPSLKLIWYTKADPATCFGVYDAPAFQSIVSHGELEMARLNYSGKVLWTASGRDIFSEGFELYERHAEAVDFYGARYRFDIETGRYEIIAP